MRQEKRKIMDYPCTISYDADTDPDTSFQKQLPYCVLPKDHTLEAENLMETGKMDFYHTLEELQHLPEFHLEKGRMKDTLDGCRRYIKDGKTVMFQVSGPFTILNGLTDLGMVYRALRRQKEELKPVLDHLQKQLLIFMKAISDMQIPLISYADPAGGVKMLGHETAAWMAENFTCPLFRAADEIMNPRTTVVFCPKTALALIGANMAEKQIINLQEIKTETYTKTYAEACTELAGKVRFFGQTCMHQGLQHFVNGQIEALVLKG